MPNIRKCSTAFIETDVDDEVVIVSLDEGKFFSLKDTGRAIWKMIDGSLGREAILERLAQDYDAPRETLAQDLDAFLADATKAGMIETGDAPAET